MSHTNKKSYIRPVGVLFGSIADQLISAGQAYRLAGGPFSFSHAEMIASDSVGNIESKISSVEGLKDNFRNFCINNKAKVTECLEHFIETRESFAGFSLSGLDYKPRILGVLNVTPDSFFDGGLYETTEAAISHARALHIAGADIIDIGGESTRPGAKEVSLDEELSRVMPVVKALSEDGIVVSVDTRHSEVMRQVIGAGAKVINDVSALRHDAESLSVVANNDVDVILMHMRGLPETMQNEPFYKNVVLDVYDMLYDRINHCLEAGIERKRICVDPGVGFGKSVEHNLELISSLSIFQGLGCGLAIGISRKSFIDSVSKTDGPDRRLLGSIASLIAALNQGVNIVRVHDVSETLQAINMWHKIVMER
ncbi:MAG: dihydropteroate synthase [Alphaproteobacteria bacterium]|jgi:dihydropteroate synthase|nr:dihydropteroate synthase [Alphaproteobacteria bacterium]PPR14593.1 MAG: Dihydropteroate synthase [Alphaproteobacteria bacterium MarineAlpha12_Bin1]|tara:strand:- start:1977 stop:3080 length:1104 start_codon:yes stop_codon:yes gene_type:complete